MNTKILKELYHRGIEVVLDYMDDKYAPPQGIHGKVFYVDDIGQIHVKWDNGSTLALIYGEDKFHTV